MSPAQHLAAALGSRRIEMVVIGGAKAPTLMAQLKQRRARQAQPVPAAALAFADLPDDAIIEL